MEPGFNCMEASRSEDLPEWVIKKEFRDFLGEWEVRPYICIVYDPYDGEEETADFFEGAVFVAEV
jgi:hypothetical protein